MTRREDWSAPTRRDVLRSAVALAGFAALQACSPGPPERSTGALTPRPSPSPHRGGRVSIGAFRAKRTPEEKWTDALAEHEALAGRPVDIARNYHPWDEPGVPLASEVQRAVGGQALNISILTRRTSGEIVRWGDIANGRYDGDLAGMAGRFKNAGRVMLGLQHEPEDARHVANGTPQEYAGAFRRVHEVFAREGVTNVEWVWNVMGITGDGWAQRYPTYYPGADYVDWVAFDRYNWAHERDLPWQTFEETVRPFYEYAVSTFPGKNLMLGEYGTVEDPADPQRKAEWFRQIPQALETLPHLRALVYFDSLRALGATGDWAVDTSPQSAEGYAQMVQTIAAQRDLSIAR